MTTTIPPLKETAVAIRQELRHAFPDTRFGVVMSESAGRIDVRWTDGPTEQSVRETLVPFGAMTFDTFEGIYRVTGVTTWSCSSIGYHRRFSDELHERTSALVKRDTDGTPFIHDDTTGRSYAPAIGGDLAQNEVINRYLRDHNA